ncbi:MAG: hypothetical protein J07HX64_01244 [halophilic archaeon J07HX64]|nr:MAG: hypothetical protein J07HX64_01244 [halophilic archaeon J07HX64]
MRESIRLVGVARSAVLTDGTVGHDEVLLDRDGFVEFQHGRPGGVVGRVVGEHQCVVGVAIARDVAVQEHRHDVRPVQAVLCGFTLLVLCTAVRLPVA